MSFSTQTKDELAHIYTEKRCCQLAELAALVRMDGTICISSEHKVGLQVTTENAAVARKIFRLLKKVFALEPEIRVQRKTRLKKNNIYNVRLNPHPQMNSILQELGILGEDGSILPGIKKSLVKKQCCRRCYLRGIFLGAGSVNSPEGNYHLEIITSNLEYAEDLARLINSYEGLQAKVSSRKNWHLVYLKESEQIVSFLNIIGAHQALLNFENVRIVKGMRNQVNRLVNCETANLNKTVNASLRQIENIKLIDDMIGIDKLSPRLRQIARLRLENPDTSLKELGEMMDPPVGKSGVNHRIRKIEELAEELRGRINTIKP
ncbi:MAG: sporulation transcription regulator whiA [Peptococcaceae bacterium]|nr:sporulation transcription regulator whiA [Peptococcaceae bacterium]